MTNSDEADLLRRAKRGCAESAAALVARHQAAVVDYAARLLARRGGSRADADDMAQEALVRALVRLDRLESGRAFAPWLFAIVRRRCLNHLRAARRRAARETARTRLLVAAHHDDPAATSIGREESERLWEIAGRALPEKQFSALWLRVVEDLSVAEIATVLARPEATVKVLLFRARRRLADALETGATRPATLPLRAVHGRRMRHG